MQQAAQQFEITLNHVLLKLLDWPFLLFVVLLLFMLAFRKQLSAIFSRGDISLSWGDRSIRLRELSENLDKELEPLHEEVEALKEAVELLQLNAGTPKSQHIGAPTTMSASSTQLNDAKRRIQEALRSGKYRWRSVERLAAIGGISETQALDILRSDSEVVLGIGKSGRQIARFKSR